MGVTRAAMPVHSVKCASAKPGTTSFQLKLRYGSTKTPGAAPVAVEVGTSDIGGPLELGARATLELGDAEDDELSWFHRGNADDHHQLAGVDDLGGIGFGVALHEEGGLRGGAEQRAVAPYAREERSHVTTELVPQQL